jgi:predicted alpha/beta superfamily hydrolase
MPYPFVVDGQQAWSHDDGFRAGYFHTFDALTVGAPGDAPHTVHVMLPRSYSDCSKRYPVVYMNDGQTTFWPGGAQGQSWRVAESLDVLYQARAIPEVVVVAIVPKDREFEYSHTPAVPGRACCGADRYTAYVADHVKRFIDSNYRTKPERQSTSIIGSSRGGLSAFFVATRRPAVFGQAGCLSPSFWVGLDPVFGGALPGGSLADSALIKPIDATLRNKAQRPRLWIDWGLRRVGGDAIEEAATRRGREMVALLKSTYGYAEPQELVWYEDPQGIHDENSWARRFPEVLKVLVGPAQ